MKCNENGTKDASSPKLPQREKWNNKTEFLLSCLGYAIGIGNVWRFPYMCYRNGGGAFLVPYLLMLFFCGVPLFFLETTLGQFGSIGCISLYKLSPLFKGAGYAIIVVNLIVCTYFNIVISYPIMFLTYCFQDTLPWSRCGNSWNTKYCAEFRKDGYTNAINADFITHSNFSNKKTPADEFFHHKILEISENVDEVGSIVWPLFWCNLFSWIVTYLCIVKGVKSVGKVVYFTATFPFFVLIVLFIRGVTLPGAWEGIKFYVVPEWSQLTNIKVWADAAIQIFFSLGPGWGGLINVASYNDFRNNGRLDAIIVPLANSGTSIFAGFVVFSVLGFLAHETGLPVASVATGGPGLAYVTYPEAIALLPFPHIWAVLFFLMLFFLGLDSSFVQIETLITGLVDEFPQLKKRQSQITIGTITIMGVLSTIYITNGGMYWLQIFDWYSASISVVLICLVEVFAVSWVYGVKNYKRDIEFMLQEKLSLFWIVSWKFTTPILLLFIFVMLLAFNTRISYNQQPYPDWMIAIGWSSCAISMICIPVYIVYRLLFTEKGTLAERIKSATKPSDWGPADPLDREEWEQYLLQSNVAGTNSATTNHQVMVQLKSVMEK